MQGGLGPEGGNHPREELLLQGIRDGPDGERDDFSGLGPSEAVRGRVHGVVVVIGRDAGDGPGQSQPRPADRRAAQPGVGGEGQRIKSPPRAIQG